LVSPSHVCLGPLVRHEGVKILAKMVKEIRQLGEEARGFAVDDGPAVS